MTPIRVEVDYHFAEYRTIVGEFMPRALKNRRPPVDGSRPWNKPWAEKLVLAVILRPVFWFKKRRVGRCAFEFTDAGLSRTSKDGKLTRTWKQVAVVHRLSAAYLIELEEGGAMPLPYRVFGPAERAAFDAILSQQEISGS